MIYLFEDNTLLSPLSTTRLLPTLRIGIYSLAEYIALKLHKNITVLSNRKAVMDASSIHCTDSCTTKEGVFINARVLPTEKNMKRLLELLNTTESVWHKDILIACKTGFKGKYSYEKLKEAAETNTEKNEWEGSHIQYPWEIVKYTKELLPEHIQLKLDTEKYESIQDNVYTGENVSIHPSAIFDTSKGPILLEKGVEIKALSVLKGPLFLGQSTTVNEHALLEHSSISHHCKVGGEIKESIMYEYSNKQHYGSLLHSAVGSWVNIGAGATNSDLKNTYGTIRIMYNGKKIDTGEILLGSIIGDFSKIAINTSLFTGKIIGVNTHVFGNVLENVDDFLMYYKGIGGENMKCTLESAITTQERMFKRRGIQQKEEDRKLLISICNAA